MKKLIFILIIIFAGFSAYGQLDTTNIGTGANTGTGETIRSAFQKVNDAIRQININTDSLKLKLNKVDTLTLSNRIDAKLNATHESTYNHTNYNTAYTDRLKWDGGSTGLTAATGRTSLGGTTVGQALFTLTNPSAIRVPLINADNTVTATATTGTGNIVLSGSPTLSGTVALGSGSITMTGSIAATGNRVTKGWFTDLEVTNLPTVNGGALKTALSLTSSDVGLGNVTNESKATMFTNPTFTENTTVSGKLLLDHAGEYTSAHGVVIDNELSVTGTDKMAGYFYAGSTLPTSSTRLNYDGYLWATRLYGGSTYFGVAGNVNTTLQGIDSFTPMLINRVASNTSANICIDKSNTQDGIGGVGGTNIGFIINNVMKFTSKATQNESSVKLLVNNIEEYTGGSGVTFASVPKVSTTDTLATQAYARSVSGSGGVSEATVSAIVHDSLTAVFDGATELSDIAVMLADSTGGTGHYASHYDMTTGLAGKLAISDTANMLSNYAKLSDLTEEGISLSAVQDEIADSLNALRPQVRMLADTVPIVTFSLGAGLAADTACFNNNVLAGSFFNGSSDTLKITKLVGILKEGTGTETIGVQVAWHTTFLSGSATNLNSSALTVNSITTGTVDTSFANSKIPPNVFVWCILSGASKDNKPTFMNVTLSGYKIPKY